MNKILAIGFIVLCLASLNECAYSYTVRKISPAYGSSTADNAYCNDLLHVEQYLFGKTYRKESINSRLNRIEKKIFNKTYSTMNTASRMNNILTNYRTANSTTRNSKFLSESTNPWSSYSYYTTSGGSIPNRMYNRFIGRPTGFTPPIINSPFHRNSFRPGFRSMYRPQYRHGIGHRYGYHRPRVYPRVNSRAHYGQRTYFGNPYVPTTTSTSIKILD